MEILVMAGKVIIVSLTIGGVVFFIIDEWRNYRFIWQVWKRFRFRMFFEMFGFFLLTTIVIVALWQVPGLKYGWTNHFFSGGGNMITAPFQEASKSTSVLVRLVPPLFFLVLMLFLPFFARFEEIMFRKGHDKLGSIIKQSIKFGLIHCLVGVPLAAGFGFIIPGFIFGCKYKHAFDSNVATLGRSQAEDEAVMVSTAYHTMYNMVVFSILITISLVAI